nr:MAG TPA: hypothetical protein [Caudoviricetes sp.]
MKHHVVAWCFFREKIRKMSRKKESPYLTIKE